jgi:DNA-binding protein YbaB
MIAEDPRFRGGDIINLRSRKMFDKIKKLKQLKDLQSALGKERMDVEKNGVTVTINGKIEFENIRLNPELDQDKQEKAVRDCVNEAVKKIQFKVAQRMSQMPGFNF